MKLWRLLKIEGCVLIYVVLPLQPAYIGERRTTFVKASYIVKDVGMLNEASPKFVSSSIQSDGHFNHLVIRLFYYYILEGTHDLRRL